MLNTIINNRFYQCLEKFFSQIVVLQLMKVQFFAKIVVDPLKGR